MKKDFSYYLPTKIIYGIDSFLSIDKFINGRKTLLVTSSGFLKRSKFNNISEISPYIIKHISNIKSHPEFKDLENIYNEIIEEEFELILAIGGGSVIDASKFLSIQNKDKNYSFVENLIKKKTEDKEYFRIPIISVPTTAGTGSEITPWATIWDMDEKKKYSLHLPDLFSEFAIYDPTLTISIPLDITIQTGLDTLSHSLESIWNKNASPITIDYAIKSSKLIMNNLFELSQNLENIKYRNNIMMACMYSGMAFSNTQTAIAHGFSYYITANKGVDHGIACSFTLPLLIDNIIGEYSFIDNAIRDIFGELSSSKLRDLLRKLNISTKFKDYGLVFDEYKILIDSLDNNQRAGNSLVKFKIGDF